MGDAFRRAESGTQVRRCPCSPQNPRGVHLATAAARRASFRPGERSSRPHPAPWGRAPCNRAGWAGLGAPASVGPREGGARGEGQRPSRTRPPPLRRPRSAALPPACPGARLREGAGSAWGERRAAGLRLWRRKVGALGAVAVMSLRGFFLLCRSRTVQWVLWGRKAVKRRGKGWWWFTCCADGRILVFRRKGVQFGGSSGFSFPEAFVIPACNQ